MRDQNETYEGALGPQGPDVARFSRREALALHLAHSLADAPFRLSDEFLEELRTEFTDDEIVEMIFACALFSWGNILGIATRVQCSDDSPYGELDWEAQERRKRPDISTGLPDR